MIHLALEVLAFLFLAFMALIALSLLIVILRAIGGALGGLFPPAPIRRVFLFVCAIRSAMKRERCQKAIITSWLALSVTLGTATWDKTTEKWNLSDVYMTLLFSIGRHVRRHALRQEFTE